MKKIVFLLCIFFLLIIIFIESRRFVCVNKEYYITIWKAYSKCYIIPGKYYGLFSPTTHAIEVGKSDVLTLYFSDSIPNTIFYKSDDSIKIIDNNKDELLIANYYLNSSLSDSLLYVKGAIKNNEVKEHVQMIDILLEDNFIIDKNGKKL